MAVTQSHYRFGIDSGTESSHGWHAAEDTNPAFGVIPLDTTFLLRFCLQCDGTAQNNAAPQFQYRVNGGTWTNITTTSNVARAVAATAFNDTDPTTQRLSGTGTFEASSQGCTEDGLAGGAQMDIVANGNAETECSMQLRSADLAVGDLVEFRTVNTATPWATYAVIPALGIPLQITTPPTETRPKIFEQVAAAIGAAMLSAGLFEVPAKVVDTVAAQLVTPPLTIEVVAENIRLSEEMAVPSERLLTDDGGRVDLFGLGNPVKITDGPVLAEIVSNDLSRNVVAESLKVVDTVLRTLDPLITSITETLKVQDIQPTFGVQDEILKLTDSVTAQLNPLIFSALTESLKVVDTVTTLVGISDEVLKLSDVVSAQMGIPDEIVRTDDGGFVELIGPGNPIRIADGPVVAALSGNDLGAQPGEALKVVDIVSASIDLVVITNEQVKIVDGPAVGSIGFTAQASEQLKIADSVTVLLDPEQTALTESLKIVDSVVIFINPEETSPAESLKVVDAVLGPTLDPEQTTLSESLKVVDTVVVVLTPELASLSENLKVVDALSVALIDAGTLASNLSEALKVVDTVAVLLNPEQTTPLETLKLDEGGFVTIIGPGNPVRVVDGPVVAALFDPNQMQASLSEALKVVDTVSAARLPYEVNVSEGFRIADSGEVELSKDETVKITDTVTAVLGTGVSLNETLKVVDTVLVTLNPEQAVLAESIKVVDTLTVVLGAGAFVSEALKAVDTVIATLNPEQAGLTESLKVADSISASLQVFDLSASITESLKVVDSVTAAREHVAQVATENVKIADTVTAVLQLAIQVSEQVKITDIPATLLNPLQAVPTENVKVQDQLSVASGTTLLATASESLKLVDTLVRTLDPEETVRIESAKIIDTLVAVLNPEQTEIGESVRCADSLQVVLDPLNATITESLEVVEEAPRFGGPRVIDIVGSYSTSVADLSGFVASTMDITGNYPPE